MVSESTKPQIFYISDTHFCHKNIIGFDNRPFFDVTEMNAALIENWNSVVSKRDIVYVLGDFCWSAEEKVWKNILDSLNGQKNLIKGNHDLNNMSSDLKRRWADIKSYKEITDNGKHVIMCHYPMPCYRSSYNPNCYMLYGHVHNTRESDFIEEWTTQLRTSRRNPSDSYGHLINVGCMKYYMNYIPRTLDELILSKEIQYATTY